MIRHLHTKTNPARLTSPPRGRFSHLAMFRLGSLLFIPAYLTVIIYRVFASPTSGGNFILMAGGFIPIVTLRQILTYIAYCSIGT